nr:bacterial Ig-like domain-containing protein [Treponema sp.]
MKKMRWFGKLCCAFAAVTLASLSVMGCDLEVDDKDNRYEEVGYAATGLSVTGQTTSFVVGSEFSLGNGVCTATYSYGDPATVTDEVVQSGFDSSAVASSQTVTLSYTHGGKTVTTSYDVKITSPIKSIAVTSQPTKTTYDLYIQNVPALDLTGMVVTATYDDDTTDVVDNSELSITLPTKVGENELTVSYGGVKTTVTVTVGIFVSGDSGNASWIPLSMCGYTGSYTSTLWWTEISSGDVEVAVGSAKQTVFVNNSYGTGNWSGAVYRIANSDSTTEFAVCRNDNYGWKGDLNTGTEGALPWVLESNWNWDTCIADITGSTEYVTVVNNGTTIDLYLHFVKNGSVIRYQYYKGIVGDGNAIKFRPMADAGADITYCE